MGLKEAVVKKVIRWTLIGFWRACGEGKKGPTMKKVYDFVMRNRSKIGGAVVAIGGYVKMYMPEYEEVGNALIAIGGYLTGAGLHDSDKAVKTK